MGGFRYCGWLRCKCVEAVLGKLNEFRNDGTRFFSQGMIWESADFTLQTAFVKRYEIMPVRGRFQDILDSGC